MVILDAREPYQPSRFLARHWIARLFRLHPDSLVSRWLLSWAFDRLTVPPTFRPEPGSGRSEHAPAHASTLLDVGLTSQPEERLSLHTVAATRPAITAFCILPWRRREKSVSDRPDSEG
jgi:hypothetical protein